MFSPWKPLLVFMPWEQQTCQNPFMISVSDTRNSGKYQSWTKARVVNLHKFCKKEDMVLISWNTECYILVAKLKLFYWRWFFKTNFIRVNFHIYILMGMYFFFLKIARAIHVTGSIMLIYAWTVREIEGWSIQCCWSTDHSCFEHFSRELKPYCHLMLSPVGNCTISCS